MKAMQKRMNDTDARKHQIIEKASALFLARGYHGTGIDDIARACGIVRGTIIRYFGSKEGLYKEILFGESNTAVNAVMAVCMNEEIPAGVALEMLVSVTMKQYKENYAWLKENLKNEESLQNYEVMRLPVFRRLRKCLYYLIERGVKEGIMEPGDASLRSYTMIYAVYGILMSLAEPEAVEAEINYVMSMCRKDKMI